VLNIGSGTNYNDPRWHRLGAFQFV
jgi:hypothetical protein